MSIVARFRVGDHVRLRRDLPSLRAETEGLIRGVAADANGIRYAVRFAKGMCSVAECDLSGEGPTR